MTSRLSFRLFCWMMLLVVLSGITWTVLSRRSTQNMVSRVVQEERATLERAHLARVVHQLEEAWAQAPTVATLVPILDTFLTEENRFEATVIVDANGRVLTYHGTSQGPFDVSVTDQGLQVNWDQSSGKTLMLKGDVPLMLGHQRHWILPIPDLSRSVMTLERPYLTELDRLLWLTGGITLLFALLISALIAHGVVAPVRQLARATQDLASGHFKSRVAIRGSHEVAQLGNAFNTMAASLERSETLRQQLVSDVAHELRTPLTALLGQLEAMQDGLLPRDDTMLASLHDDVIHLSAIVTDLQELALAEAKQLHLEWMTLNVAHEVARACQAFGYPIEGLSGCVQHPKRSITLSYHLTSDLYIRADKRRLRQILHNLLENAVRHAQTSVHIVAHEAANQVVFTLQDDGLGIAEEHVPHVFERFYRDDASRQRASGGAGLGLAIVKELVVLHGGEIRITETGATGTTVSFWLPRLSTPDLSAKGHSSGQDTQACTSLT